MVIRFHPNFKTNAGIIEEEASYKRAAKKQEKKVKKVVVCVFLYVTVCFFFSYGRKQHVFEALAAGELAGHPLASACWRGTVTATVTITTSRNASAATIAIIAIDDVFAVFSFDE